MARLVISFKIYTALGVIVFSDEPGSSISGLCVREHGCGELYWR